MPTAHWWLEAGNAHTCGSTPARADWNEHTGANQWEAPSYDQATQAPRVARPQAVQRHKTPAAKPKHVKVEVKQDDALATMLGGCGCVVQ